MRLYVNIDHVATIREARKTDEPDPVQAAAAAERAGADGITVHLREDRRHIQDADVTALARSVRTVLNLELGAHAEIVRIAARIKPFQATLVPEKRQEITTEGGLALRKGDRRLAGAIARLKDAGIRVSLFIDPSLKTIDIAQQLGVPAIEIHTGTYANASKITASKKTASKEDASREEHREKALNELRKAAAHAKTIGLAVHAGHGLTYQNVQPVAAIPEIEELNIGHAIVSNAVFWGLEEAVRRMVALVSAPGVDVAPDRRGGRRVRERADGDQ
ncbi:MAG: pyridoxine 5'-phosphate synthase [Gemmatimonadetes bacterium]|nr:MAG: pyridoxine 5'-phosphate synthase [Gemmatimonadota bacterium]